MKRIIVWILICIIANSTVYVQSEGLGYDGYETSFELSGKLIEKDVQEFPLNGRLEVDVSANNSFLKYDLSYFALIPSLFDTAGSASYSENITSKSLIQENLNSTALDVVWNIFTNGIENVQSIFRITHDEIDSEQANLLNYTGIPIKSKSFLSPQLGIEINSYYVEFILTEIQYQIYYDANNLILIGLNVYITAESLNYDFDVELRADIFSSTLKLDEIGKIEQLDTIKLIGLSIFILSIIGITTFWYFRKSKTIISGGL